MAYLNVKERMLEAKIVYYGAGLSGKTTNLELVKQRTQEGRCGDMMSLNTAGDRTLFFDWLPFNMGKVNGCDVKVQLYTVPGQARYAETRRRVLAGADGVVLVLDSQSGALEKNREILADLREHMRVNRLSIERVPMVVQLNKRDLPSAMAPAELMEALGLAGQPHVEAVASVGKGVFETLQEITRLVLGSVREQARGQGAAIQSGAQSNLDGHTLYAQLTAAGMPVDEGEKPDEGRPRSGAFRTQVEAEPRALAANDTPLPPTVAPPAPALLGQAASIGRPAAPSAPASQAATSLTPTALAPSPPTPSQASPQPPPREAQPPAAARIASSTPPVRLATQPSGGQAAPTPPQAPEAAGSAQLNEVVSSLRSLGRRMESLEPSMLQKVSAMLSDQRRAAAQSSDEIQQRLSRLAAQVEGLEAAQREQPSEQERWQALAGRIEELPVVWRAQAEALRAVVADRVEALSAAQQRRADEALARVSERATADGEALRAVLSALEERVSGAEAEQRRLGEDQALRAAAHAELLQGLEGALAQQTSAVEQRLEAAVQQLAERGQQGAAQALASGREIEAAIQAQLSGAEASLRERLAGVEAATGEQLGGVAERLASVEAAVAERLGGVEGAVGERLNGVEAALVERLGGVEAAIRERVHGVSERLSGVEGAVGERLAGIEATVGERLARTEQSLGERLDLLEERHAREQQALAGQVAGLVARVSASVEQAMTAQLGALWARIQGETQGQGAALQMLQSGQAAQANRLLQRLEEHEERQRAQLEASLEAQLRRHTEAMGQLSERAQTISRESLEAVQREVAAAWMVLDGRLTGIERSVVAAEAAWQALDERQQAQDQQARAVEQALLEVLRVTREAERRLADAKEASEKALQAASGLEALGAEGREALRRLEQQQEPLRASAAAMQQATEAMLGGEQRLAGALGELGAEARALTERAAAQGQALQALREQLAGVERGAQQLAGKVGAIEQSAQAILGQGKAQGEALAALQESARSAQSSSLAAFDSSKAALVGLRDALGQRIIDLNGSFTEVAGQLQGALQETSQALIFEVAAVKGAIDGRVGDLLKQGTAQLQGLREQLERRLQALDARVVTSAEISRLMNGAASSVVSESSAVMNSNRDQLARLLKDETQNVSQLVVRELRQAQAGAETRGQRVEQSLVGLREQLEQSGQTQGAELAQLAMIERSVAALGKAAEVAADSSVQRLSPQLGEVLVSTQRLTPQLAGAQGALEERLGEARGALEGLALQQQAQGVQLRQVQEQVRQVHEMMKQASEKKGWWRA